jgi:hypothetical protein
MGLTPNEEPICDVLSNLHTTTSRHALKTCPTWKKVLMYAKQPTPYQIKVMLLS